MTAPAARRTPAAKKQAPQRTVFDVDAARAARAEAAAEPFLFSLGGQEFEIPPAAEWPIMAVQLMAEGKLQEAMEELLGPVQSVAFRQVGARIADVTAVMEAVSSWQGFDSLGG